MVETMRFDGAQVVTGGRRATIPGFEEGFWYEPTVLVVNRNDIAVEVAIVGTPQSRTHR
jgi:hypothetical protein